MSKMQLQGEASMSTPHPYFYLFFLIFASKIMNTVEIPIRTNIKPKNNP